MPAALIRHHANREFYDYWNGLRGVQSVPEQGRMDPAAMGEALPDVFIIDRTEPGVYTIRLAGTRLCAFWGRELRGTNALDLWTGEDREGAEMLLYSVLEDAAVAVAGQRATTLRGNGIEMEMIAMPLSRRTKDGVERRIIGTLSPWRTPFWLGQQTLSHQSIDSVRLVWPDRMSPLDGQPITAPSATGFLREVTGGRDTAGDEGWSTADALADLARLRGREIGQEIGHEIDQKLGPDDAVFESERAAIAEEDGDMAPHVSGMPVLARRAHLTLLGGGADEAAAAGSDVPPGAA